MHNVSLDSDNIGFWGPRTSNNDFCEDNYAVTQFVAEFFNSLTSLGSSPLTHPSNLFIMLILTR